MRRTPSELSMGRPSVGSSGTRGIGRPSPGCVPRAVTHMPPGGGFGDDPDDAPPAPGPGVEPDVGHPAGGAGPEREGYRVHGAADRRPTLLALRALQIGDLLVAVPALRALRRAHPEHRL